jgi:cytochrome c oxidase subunit 2
MLPAVSGLAAGLGSASVFGAGTQDDQANDESNARVINITAERFRYTPNQITLKLGEPVVLSFTTLDLPMGFNAPTLGVRANILPDVPVQIRLVPKKPGTHHFYCDIACGSGHPDMKGVIVVA